jgi:hypothetical protein
MHYMRSFVAFSAAFQTRFLTSFLVGFDSLASALGTAFSARYPRESQAFSSERHFWYGISGEQTRFSEQVCAELSKAREQSGFGGHVECRWPTNNGCFSGGISVPHTLQVD